MIQRGRPPRQSRITRTDVRPGHSALRCMHVCLPRGLVFFIVTEHRSGFQFIRPLCRLEHSDISGNTWKSSISKRCAGASIHAAAVMTLTARTITLYLSVCTCLTLVLAIPSFEGISFWHDDIGSLVPGMSYLEALGPNNNYENGHFTRRFVSLAAHEGECGRFCLSLSSKRTYHPQAILET